MGPYDSESMKWDHANGWLVLWAALLAFAIYRRFRRNFGRQALRPKRMVVRIGLLCVIAALLLPAAERSAQFTLAIATGLAAGLGLGIWAGTRTRFETHDGTLHYIPHTYTGLVVFALFAARMAYRFGALLVGGTVPGEVPGAAAAPNSFQLTLVQSPLTLGLFFVLIGYYVVYYSQLLWKSRHLKSEDIEAPAPEP
jgi:hypothetical protein